MSDTIAAIASGITASGIGIIRISGPEAFAVLGRIFKPRTPGDVSEYRTQTIHYGHILNREEVIDECLVMIMRGPHSYTTEDTVEINCHGGPYVMRKILHAVCAAGARPAEPGEFTKRAFLGGRIDLSEAEAVMDVIGAGSSDALRSSLNQLSGSVKKKISSLRERIMNELAYIEAALDDPEHMSLEGYPEELDGRLLPLIEEIQRLDDTFQAGRMVHDGIKTVILGKPNAGKSSLLNALSGEDRAIVTDIEGTTRDTLEEQIELGGLSLRMIDTAGIRMSEDKIEQIGIERARKSAEEADLVLAVFDSSKTLDENDFDIIRMIRQKKTILILNKSDLDAVTDENSIREIYIRESSENMAESVFSSESIGTKGTDIVSGTDIAVDSELCPPLVTISAKEQTGLQLLEEKIRDLFFAGKININEETLITNVRHHDALDRSLRSLDLVRESIADAMPEDFFSIDLMDAYRALGEIIGEEVDDDLVDTIFSKFCMGK